jgi:RNA polymerase sigma factor (sigma-70 family)
MHPTCERGGRRPCTTVVFAERLKSIEIVGRPRPLQGRLAASGTGKVARKRITAVGLQQMNRSVASRHFNIESMAHHTHQVLTELLVLRAQAGHHDAIGLLVREWHERLLRHAQRLTGAEDAALDVVQEAWLEVCRGLNSLDDPARFGPWAYKIVTRRSARWVRRRQRRREVEQGRTTELTMPATRPDPSATSDTVDAVRIALRRLPVEQQAILELRYVEDFGIEQIAVALGIAAGTVKSRLFHARQNLRDFILKVTQ